MYETHTRSVVKSLLWRVIATLISVCMAYLFTGSVTTAAEISLSGAAISIGIYYLHERVWDSIHWGRARQFRK